jgi:hypothetical protein
VARWRFHVEGVGVSTRAWQVIGVIVAGIAAAGAAVVTNLLTERWTWALAVGLGALVVVGLSGQLLALRSTGADDRAGVHGGGPGSIVIGHNNNGTVNMGFGQPYPPRPSSPDTGADKAADDIR